VSHEQTKLALTALGDQIQAAVKASPIDVVGFVLVVNLHDGSGTTEIRTKLEREHFMHLLRAVTD
jgi:hypothetical protein